ncbi:hypothetical protein TVH25_00200 [Rhodococcus sp. 7Tela_A2]|uniref:hypothetical protein n=1 Tax=Rhodococcus sp. 7Tela_A2 TaxID=3093744 RepID=UPI003BB49EA6
MIPTAVRASSESADGWNPKPLFGLLILALLAAALIAAHKHAMKFVESHMANGENNASYPPLPIVADSHIRAARHIEVGTSENSSSRISSGKLFLCSSASLIQRIQHSINQSGIVYENSVISSMEIPSNLSHDFVIIASACAKGSMLDSLNVKVDGDDVSTIPAFESNSLQAGILTTWRQEIAPFEIEPWRDPTWLALMSAVCSDSPVMADAKSLIWNNRRKEFELGDNNPSLQNLLDFEARRMSSLGASSAAASQLLIAIEELANLNILWCRPDSSTKESADNLSLRLEVSFRRHLEAAAQSWYERLRVGFGLVPRSFAITMPLSLRAASYHLDFATPEGMYLYDITIGIEAASIDHFGSTPAHPATGSTAAHPATGWAVARRDVTHSARGEANPVLRASRTGSGFAHVYCRGVGDLVLRSRSDAKDSRNIVPTAKFEFREVPPGNLLWAILLAIYLTGLAWFVGFGFDAVFPAEGQMKPIWNTVLFGLPAVLSGLVVAKFTGGQIQTASLPTFVAIVCTVLDAMFLIIVAALLSMGLWSWRWDGEGLLIPNIEVVPWALVMILTGTNLCIIAVMMLMRHRRYMRSLQM